MKLKVFLAILLVVLVVGGLAAVKTLQIKKLIANGQSYAPPPETVSSAVVHEDTWQRTLMAIGTVAAIQGVNVTAELPGLITEITFESGATVAKGDLLVKLDVSSEMAQLKGAEAQVELARVNLKRSTELMKGSTISQAELDAAVATLKQNESAVETLKAAIEKKTIRAPFAGRLGIRLVNLGQYLETGKPIVSLQSINTVYGDFALPQQHLTELKTGMRVRLTTDAYAGRQFEGVLTAINPDLDQATRSVGLRATFTNDTQLLRPGMFARMEVLLPGEQKVLVIPATSVLSAPYGDSVYVIESKTGKDNKPGLSVRQQFIRLGRPQGDFISVESGLKAGEKIVSSGLFKLRNGMGVVENNEIAPKSDKVPHPADS